MKRDDKIPIIRQDKEAYILVQDLINLIFSKVNSCGNSDAVCIAKYAKDLAELAINETKDLSDKILKALTLALKAYELATQFDSRLSILEQKDYYLDDIRNTIINLSNLTNINTRSIEVLMNSKIMKITSQNSSGYVEYVFKTDDTELGRIRVYLPITYQAGNHIEITNDNVINAVGFAEVAFTGDYADLSNTPNKTYHMVAKFDDEYIDGLIYFDVYINRGKFNQRYYHVTLLDWHNVVFDSGETCTLDVKVDDVTLLAINGQLKLFTTRLEYPTKIENGETLFFHWELENINYNPVIYGGLVSDGVDSEIKVYLNSLEGPVIADTIDMEEIYAGGLGYFPFILKDGYYIPSNCSIIDWEPYSMFPLFWPSNNNPQEFFIKKFPKHGYIIVAGVDEINPEPEEQEPTPPTYHSIKINYLERNSEGELNSIDPVGIILSTGSSGRQIENDPILCLFLLVDSSYEFYSIESVYTNNSSTGGTTIESSETYWEHTIASLLNDVVINVVITKKAEELEEFDIILEDENFEDKFAAYTYYNNTVYNGKVIQEYAGNIVVHFKNYAERNNYQFTINKVELKEGGNWTTVTNYTLTSFDNGSKAGVKIKINSPIINGDVRITGSYLDKTISVIAGSTQILSVNPTSISKNKPTATTIVVTCDSNYIVNSLLATNGDLLNVSQTYDNDYTGPYTLVVNDYSADITITGEFTLKVAPVTKVTISLAQNLINLGFKINNGSNRVTSIQKNKGDLFGTITIDGTRPYQQLVSTWAVMGNKTFPVTPIRFGQGDVETQNSHLNQDTHLYTGYEFTDNTILNSNVVINGEVFDVTPATPVEPEVQGNYFIELAGDLHNDNTLELSSAMSNAITSGIAPGTNITPAYYYIDSDLQILITRITRINPSTLLPEDLPINNLTSIVTYTKVGNKNRVTFSISNVLSTIIIYGMYLSSSGDIFNGLYQWYQSFNKEGYGTTRPNKGISNDYMVLAEPITSDMSNDDIEWLYKCILLSAAIFKKNSNDQYEYVCPLYDANKGINNLPTETTNTDLEGHWRALYRKDQSSTRIAVIVNIEPAEINLYYTPIEMPYKIGYLGFSKEALLKMEEEKTTLLNRTFLDCVQANEGWKNNSPSLPLYSFRNNKVHLPYPRTKYTFAKLDKLNNDVISSSNGWINPNNSLIGEWSLVDSVHLYLDVDSKECTLPRDISNLIATKDNSEAYLFAYLVSLYYDDAISLHRHWGKVDRYHEYPATGSNYTEISLVVNITSYSGLTYTEYLSYPDTAALLVANNSVLTYTISTDWCDIKIRSGYSSNGWADGFTSTFLKWGEHYSIGTPYEYFLSSGSGNAAPYALNVAEFEIIPKDNLDAGQYSMVVEIGPYGSSKENPTTTSKNNALQKVILEYNKE